MLLPVAAHLELHSLRDLQYASNFQIWRIQSFTYLPVSRVGHIAHGGSFRARTNIAGVNAHRIDIALNGAYAARGSAARQREFVRCRLGDGSEFGRRGIHR